MLKIELTPADTLNRIVREQEEAKRTLCDAVRSNLLDAIQILADAASHPLIARQTLERARPLLKEAMRAATELDPDIYDEPGDDEYHAPHGPLTNHDLTDDQRLDMPRTL